MGNRKIEFLAGMFFLVGIVLFAGMVWTLGIKKDIGEKRFSVKVYFGNIGGLNIGAPAMLSGVNIGYVESVDFVDSPFSEKDVRVVLNVAEKYRGPLQECTQYTIATSGILGDKLVKISKLEGSDETCILDQPIAGNDPLELQDLTKSLQDTAQSLSSLANETNMMVQDLDYILVTAKRVLNRIESHIIDGTLFKVF